jgi:hypothetical protein
LEHALIANRSPGVVSLLLLAVGLVGCASSNGGAPAPGNAVEAPAKPWADLIKSTYDSARTPAEREALADGKISDTEYAYFQQLIVTCLKKIGVVATWSSDHSLDYTRPDSVSNSAVDKCNKDNGLDLIVLRDAMNRNPQQLDENTILVDCLKRVKAVDPGYTPSMLARGVDVDEFINSSQFDKCNADPLNYGSSK